MENIFITAISLQGKRDLEKVVYSSETVKYNEKTRFPIIPIIAEHKDDYPDYKILAVVFGNEDSNRNYLQFCEEVEDLGVDPSRIIPINAKNEVSNREQSKIIKEIVKNVGDDSQVYTCVTYGFKATAIILAFLMNVLPLLKPNCTIRGMYYGFISRNNSESEQEKCRLCDLTKYIHLVGIVKNLYELDLADPEEYFLDLISKFEVGEIDE